MNHSSVKYETVMVNNITSYNNMNHQRSGSCCCGCYIVVHYCLRFARSGSYCCGCYIVVHYCLRFDRGVVHIVVAGYIVDHYCFIFDRGVVHIIVVSYIVELYYLRFDEPLLYQTSNSNGQQYNSHNNMNHSSVKH
jgi:hypothetical protein